MEGGCYEGERRNASVVACAASVRKEDEGG